MVNKKGRGLFVSAVLISTLMVLSKVSGFVREAVIAGYFGASLGTDLFFLSSGVMGGIFMAVGTALASIFLPIYSEKLINQGREEASNFTSKTISFFFPAAIMITIIILIISPQIAKVSAPSYHNGQLQDLISFIRIISISFIFFIGMYIFSSILNAEKNFLPPQLTGLIYSSTIILSIIFVSKHLGIMSLIYAYPVSYLLQMVIMWLWSRPFFKFHLVVHAWDDDVKNLLILMTPALLGNSLEQINQLIARVIASGLQIGSVSALSYAQVLYGFGTAIFVISFTTILFTTFSEYTAIGSLDLLKSEVRDSLSILTVILVPISLISVLFSYDIISIVYQRGSFDQNAVALTKNAFMFLALGFVFFGIREVLTRAFYALKDSKTPMLNGIIAVFINIILSFMLASFLGIGGIALGMVISLFITSVLLILALRRKLGCLGLSSFAVTCAKILVATIPTILIACKCKVFLASLSPFVRLPLATVVILIVYIAILYLVKCKELNLMISAIKVSK